MTDKISIATGRIYSKLDQHFTPIGGYQEIIAN